MSKLTPAQKAAFAARKRRRNDAKIPPGPDTLDIGERSLTDVLRSAELEGQPNLHLGQVRIPSTPPPGICLACLNRWLEGMKAARAGGVLERRAVECPHTSADGSKYSIAFIVKSNRPAWLCISNVDPSEWNALYERLVIHNGPGGWQAALLDLVRVHGRCNVLITGKPKSIRRERA